LIGQALQRTPQVIGDATKTLKNIAWCSGADRVILKKPLRGGWMHLSPGKFPNRIFISPTRAAWRSSPRHHATERHGIQALGEHLAERFGLEHRFFDQDNPV